MAETQARVTQQVAWKALEANYLKTRELHLRVMPNLEIQTAMFGNKNASAFGDFPSAYYPWIRDNVPSAQRECLDTQKQSSPYCKSKFRLREGVCFLLS